MTGRMLQRLEVPRHSVRARPHDATALVAEGMIVRAIRRAGLHHLFHAQPGILVVVGVHPDDAEAISDGVESALFQRDRIGAPSRTTLRISDCTGPDSSTVKTLRTLLVQNVRDGRRTVVLFQLRKEVPREIEHVADGVLVLSPLDVEWVATAFEATVGHVPGADDLALAATMPLHLLGSVVRRGIGLRRAVAGVRRLAILSRDEDSPSGSNVGSSGAAPNAPTLDDLHGLGEAADWGRSLAADISDYRAGLIGWDEVDRGALVIGPPGTGKTTFALALARTCALPIHVHSLAAWQAAGYLNALLKQMRKAFADAKANAPCILFIDELDSFGDRTQQADHNAQYVREVINAFLECLDGAVDREGVVVVGATNYPEMIDPAIKRPGRLDRQLAIPLPDATARAGILRHHLGHLLPDVNLVPVAERLEGASGAQIEQVVRDARRVARRDRRRPMLPSDLDRFLPSAVRLSDDAFWRGCVHEAGHWVVCRALAREAGVTPTVVRVFREVSEGSRGHTTFERVPGFDSTRTSHLAEIAILMAGGAAEEMILGTRGDGSGGRAGSDLHLSTAIAVRLEGSFGLGEHLVHLFDPEVGGQERILAVNADLRRRVEAVLRESLDRARSLVNDFAQEIEDTAKMLSTELRLPVARHSETKHLRVP